MKKTYVSAIVLILAIVISVLTVWTGINRRQETDLKEQELLRIEQAVDYVTAKLQIQVDDSTAVVNAVAEDYASAILPGAEEVVPGGMEALYQTEHLLKNSGFAYAAICDTEGTAYESSGESFDVSECDSYQKALTGLSVISYQSYSKNTKGPSVVFHAPVKAGEAVVAVIRVAWDEGQLDDIFAYSDFRKKENFYLLSQNSLILYESQNKFISDAMFLSLWGERDAEFQDMEQVIKQGREKSTFVTDKDGRAYCVAYQGLYQIKDWGVASVIYVNDLEKLIDAGRSEADIIVCGIVVLVASLALLVMLLYQSHKHYYLDRLAYIDGVTKSYNFKGFMMRVQKQFQNDPTAKCAILEVTLDKFDYYTELFGEEARNQLLREFSTLISHWSHGDEAHCRYNTTNFVVFIKYQNMDELRDRIIYLKDKVADFEKGETQRERFEYECLVGVVCIEGEERDIDTLLRRADAALLAAKGDKRAPFAIYNARMENSKSEDREYEARMDQALREKEFLVYLQPKFSLIDGRQVGAEALVRWMHPEKGLLYPGRFIALFEKNGFITELDIYILENICQRLAAWIHRGIQPHPISFNVSLHNLYKENFVDQAAEIVERYGVPAKLIIFEVSEGAIVENIKLMQETMERLKNRGFMISMDDFGRGTVSLNTLYQVPVDELKIERRFLLETAESSRGQSIINSIIDTSKRLGIHVVAEGVDNKQQAGMLRDLGCDMMQGFVFSEPLPEQEYDDYAYGPLSGENYISL